MGKDIVRTKMPLENGDEEHCKESFCLDQGNFAQAQVEREEGRSRWQVAGAGAIRGLEHLVDRAARRRKRKTSVRFFPSSFHGNRGGCAR